MNRVRDALARRIGSSLATRGLVNWYSFHRSRLHVISYPKCGRTWLRLGLGIALCEHFKVDVQDPADILEINRIARIDGRVPPVRFSHDDNPQTKRIGELQRSKRAYRSRDVILLVRDPRDVVVSSYHHHRLRTAHADDPSFEGSMSEFVRHPVFGIETIVAFMNIWAQNRNVPRSLHLLRYEDMTDNFELELRRVLAVAGVHEPDPEAVRKAVQMSSFESMRAMEQVDALGTERLRPADRGNPDSFKVRKGKAGGYANELNPTDLDYVDHHLKELDPWFSYQI